MKIDGFVLAEMSSQLFDILITVVFFDVLFGKGRSIGGWDFYHTLFLYAFAKFVFSIHNTMTKRGTREIATNLIREGDLDLYLVKPVDAMFMVSIFRPKIYELSGAFFALALGIYALIKGGIVVHPVNLLWLIVLLVFSLLLYYFLQLITVIPAFWLIRFWSLQFLMTKLNQFMYYPAAAFPRTLKTIFFSVFPVLAITYIPVRALFETPNLLEIGYFILITLIFGAIARGFWLLGLRSYGSASS